MQTKPVRVTAVPVLRASILESAYLAHRESLLRVSGQRDKSMAEDAVQDLFLYLLSWVGTDQRTITRAYLAEAVRNLIHKVGGRDCRRRQREARRTRERDLCKGEPISQTEAESACGGRHSTISEEMILEALDRLPPRQSEILALAICKGIGYEQIACALGVPASTVNNLRHRGVQALKHATNDIVASERSRHRRAATRG